MDEHRHYILAHLSAEEEKPLLKNPKELSFSNSMSEKEKNNTDSANSTWHSDYWLTPHNITMESLSVPLLIARVVALKSIGFTMKNVELMNNPLRIRCCSEPSGI